MNSRCAWGAKLKCKVLVDFLQFIVEFIEDAFPISFPMQQIILVLNEPPPKLIDRLHPNHPEVQL